jgi:hypothetical protein
MQANGYRESYIGED